MVDNARGKPIAGIWSLEGSQQAAGDGILYLMPIPTIPSPAGFWRNVPDRILHQRPCHLQPLQHQPNVPVHRLQGCKRRQPGSRTDQEGQRRSKSQKAKDGQGHVIFSSPAVAKTPISPVPHVWGRGHGLDGGEFLGQQECRECGCGLARTNFWILDSPL